MLITSFSNIILIVVASGLISGYNTQGCSSSPCRTGTSECEDTSTGYSCHCIAGIKGPKCEFLLKETDDLCLSNPCWGGATCSSISGSTFCTCPEGRTGIDCRVIIVDVRNTEPLPTTTITPSEIVCFNNGTLVGTVCKCTPEFTGKFCETRIQTSYVKVFNKAWYTASFTLNYRYGEVFYQQKKTLTAQTKHTFVYNITVADVTITADAVLGKRIFQEKLFPRNEIGVCYHVWGVITSPKSSRMPCW